MEPTDCQPLPTEQIEIFQVKSKPVVLSETKTVISSNAGFLVLGAIDRKMKLIDSLTSCFRDGQKKRLRSVSDEDRIQHSLRDLLCQRSYQIALGYEDGLDADELRLDPVLQLSVGKGEALGSQPMMSRLENWVSKSDIWRGWRELVSVYAKFFHEKGYPVVLHVDSTNDPVHGQLGMFNGYYYESCFHPLLITEEKSGFPFGIILRNGQVGSARRVRSILRRIIRCLKEAIPEVEIVVKGDCAFGIEGLMDELEETKVDFILGLSGNAVLYRMVEDLKQEVLQEYEKEKKPLQRFRSLFYKAGTWTKAREVVAKVEHTPEGINIRFVVSSMKAEDPETLYRSYHTRAKGIEAIIEQLKNGLRFDKTACHTKTPNQMRYFESAIALILHLKLAERMEKKFKERPTIQTLIQKVLKVAAIVKESCRRFLIEISSVDPHTEFLLYALQT
jgi:hypothetical protein